MKIAVIGYGAVAKYLDRAMHADGINIDQAIYRPGREFQARETFGDKTRLVTSVEDLEDKPDLLLDCAGHSGLREHGVAALGSGIDVATVSIGALADANLWEKLTAATIAGKSKLRLLSGAIGGLDALSSASTGKLTNVTYTGRKPPSGWKGSAAEHVLDLENLGDQPATHFTGNARQAALKYPKNANVAAAVALAGIGFDDTHIELIADPAIGVNIHEIHAHGAFGSFSFHVEAHSMPDNPKSSMLAAMSVMGEVRRRASAISF